MASTPSQTRSVSVPLSPPPDSLLVRVPTLPSRSCRAPGTRQGGPCLPMSAKGWTGQWGCWRTRRAATTWLPTAVLSERNRTTDFEIWIFKYSNFYFSLFPPSLRIGQNMTLKQKHLCRKTNKTSLHSRVLKLLRTLQWMEMNEKGEQTETFHILIESSRHLANNEVSRGWNDLCEGSVFSQNVNISIKHFLHFTSWARATQDSWRLLLCLQWRQTPYPRATVACGWRV